MFKNKEILAYLAWLSVCIVWGTTYLAIRIGVQDIPPFLFASFRWLIAGTILFSYLKFKGKKLPDKQTIYYSAAAGILMIGLGNGFVVVAEKWIPSGLTALFIATVPLWVIIIESLFPESPKLNLKIIMGILLGLIGISIIFAKDILDITNSGYLTGTLLIFFAVIFWAMGTLISKYKVKTTTPFMNAVIQMFAAGILQLLIGTALGEFKSLHITTDSFWALIYLIFFGSFLGYVSYIYSITHLPASFVSTYAYINPIIALLLGWLILNEPLNLIVIVSTLVVFSGVYLVRTGNLSLQISLKENKN